MSLTSAKMPSLKEKCAPQMEAKTPAKKVVRAIKKVAKAATKRKK